MSGGCIECRGWEKNAEELVVEIERLQAIATAAYNVFSQREAGSCHEARLVGWEELEITLRDGPRKLAVEAKGE